MGDASEGGGADVDVGLWLDLAGAVDDGDQILMSGFGGGDLGNVGLSVKDGANHDACEDQDCNYDQDDFLYAHCRFLSHPPLKGRGG